MGLGLGRGTAEAGVENPATRHLCGGLYIDALHVTQIGIDEHRYPTVRWYRDADTGAWTRVEPWMTGYSQLSVVLWLVKRCCCARWALCSRIRFW
ncbi:hypothetical protein GCM10027418_27200 [Mariniluteicoccus endophyticus]